MDVGNFISDWRNEKNFGNRFSGWNWKRAKKITDKGLLACRDNNHFAFRMQNGVVYAERELELPFTVRQKQQDGSFREIHVIPFKGEVEKKELEEEDIRKLFERLPDMPQKQRQSPLEDVQLASSLVEGVVYQATIKYGDPYKIGGYEEKIKGNLSAIKQKAGELEDYMWQKMNNGNPYIHVVIGDRNYTKRMELIPPPVFTGKWLRSHAHLLAKPYLDIVACQVFLGSPSVGATAEVKLDEVMCFVEDEKKYFSSSPKELQDNFLAWRSFSVVK